MYEYTAEVVWFFPKYQNNNIVKMKGDCMEDAINNFYRTHSGVEVMHVFDNAE